MDADFWREKWREERPGWRQKAANPMLLRRLPALGLGRGARVFVPLCGDTVDICWLLAEGFRVAGVELVETAVARLFAELGVEPTIRDVARLKRCSAERVDVFAGDLFDLKSDILGAVHATYDRAALVALPDGMRGTYARHVAEITAGAPQLLITFDYDQSRMEGPPFSVDEEEVRRLYAETYDVAPLESAEVAGGLKGFCPATERAWSLAPR